MRQPATTCLQPPPIWHCEEGLEALALQRKDSIQDVEAEGRSAGRGLGRKEQRRVHHLVAT